MYSRYILFLTTAAGLLLSKKFKRLVSILNYRSENSAAAAATAATATAAAALAALPNLEPNPIYKTNIGGFPYRYRRYLTILLTSICSIRKETTAAPATNPFFASPCAATPSTSLFIARRVNSLTLNASAPNPRAPNPSAPNLSAPNRS
ncbi:hypothetical protein BT67DRAFT_433765 [Trichocladium antarcticum]|uniref:Uncharacterized protein n=1 Tax=Trichocladium antarcticum TaxID=1450529 RepID=A0AAN6ZEP0_9PEZI|nr:hypothetical protein BT67DRAFT_433765 [Trichocladium antarcticum]